MHGHLIGAAGAIEALITVLALQQDAIPPTAHLDELDPACTGVRHVIGAPLCGDASPRRSFQFLCLRRQQYRARLPRRRCGSRNPPRPRP